MSTHTDIVTDIVTCGTTIRDIVHTETDMVTHDMTIHDIPSYAVSKYFSLCVYHGFKLHC